MNWRNFITLLAAAWPLVAWAQQGERIRRIGVLLPGVESAILLGRADPSPDAGRRRDRRERSIGLYGSRMVDYWYCHISLSWLASAAQSP
jgi:hypothetical protein